MPPSFMSRGSGGSGGSGGGQDQDASSRPSRPRPSGPSGPSTSGASRSAPVKEGMSTAKESTTRVRDIQQQFQGKNTALYQQAMSDLGFSTVESVSPSAPYMIIATDGEERCGKTHFACSAPGKIAYLGTDPNYRYVLPKFPPGKVVPNLFEVPDTQKEAVPLWERFVKTWYHCLYSGLFRTVVVDTFTDIYRLIRMAEFGKTKQVGQYSYDVVNAPLFKMVDDLTQPGASVNWILIHKMRDEYQKLRGSDKEVRTGKMVRDGWRHINYKVATTIEHYREDAYDPETGEKVDGAVFGIHIKDCGPNSGLTNLCLEGDECNFLELAMRVYPDVDPEVWIGDE